MPRKLYLSSKPCFVTSRIQSGLPLVPNSLINATLEGILAKAKILYPVRLSHYLFMANHFHLTFVPLDPEDASSFIKYVKAESAHAINRLLNRRQQTVWCKGFDAPTVLDAKKAIEVIAYLYANPARANLTDSIDKYPGVNSWYLFKSGKTSKPCYKFSRDSLFPLPTPSLTIGEQQKLTKLLRRKGEELQLEIEPDACMQCFSDEVDLDTANQMILEQVEELEEGYKTERASKGHTVIGALKLRTQSMAKNYRSSTFGKRMSCLGSSKKVRVAFLKQYMALCEIARATFEKWKLGELWHTIPSGLFPPRVPTLSCRLEL